MKRLPVFLVVSTLIVGVTGCQHFTHSSDAACSPPSVTFAAPAATVPSAPSAACGSGCNSCSSNSLPTLSGTQGYGAAPTN